MRLDQFLTQKNPDFSRSFWQRLIKQGSIKINNEVITSPKHSVGEDDQIDITEDTRPQEALPENIPLDIVYEDADLLVINKPAGMVTHPAYGHHSGTLVNALLYHGSVSTVGGLKRPGIVHRLDKDTSGLMVVAKNDSAHFHLAKQFHPDTKIAERRYYAVVHGVPQHTNGTVDAPIMRDPKHFDRMCVPKNPSEEAKFAITHYQLVKVLGDPLKPLKQRFALLECCLETGRTHQIRVHMKHLGHPIVGDKTYGSSVQQDRHELYAYYLTFEHPKTGEMVEFELPCPL